MIWFSYDFQVAKMEDTFHKTPLARLLCKENIAEEKWASHFSPEWFDELLEAGDVDSAWSYLSGAVISALEAVDGSGAPRGAPSPPRCACQRAIGRPTTYRVFGKGSSVGFFGNCGSFITKLNFTKSMST